MLFLKERCNIVCIFLKEEKPISTATTHLFNLWLSTLQCLSMGMHFNIAAITLFIHFCNQQDTFLRTNSLKVTFQFESFCDICQISDVTDKRMLLDFVFEEVQDDSACSWFTSFISVLFPCETSHSLSGQRSYHAEPARTRAEGM